MSEELISQAALELYKTFQGQGVAIVYASRCCGRLYMGAVPAKKCRTCHGTPDSVEIQSDVDLDKLK